jgi:uncharacterized protein (TIGR02444 family)
MTVETDASFWAFSVGFYGEPGVEETLLRLQDEEGLEVNLVLFCLYAAKRGARLGETERADMRQIGTEWGKGIVAPLRAARRALKPLEARSPETAALRAEVKKAELAAEKLMQEALERCLPSGGSGGDPRATAAANFEALGLVGERRSEALTVLLGQAFPER